MLYEYRRLLRTTGKGRRFLALLILRAPFDIAFTIINASFLQYAFNAIERIDSEGLMLVCARFGVAGLCLFLYNGTIWSIYAPFGVRMERTLRLCLFQKITSLPFERIEKTPHGEWATKMNQDVEAPFSRAFHLPHAACAILNVCFSALMLWCASPPVLGWVLLFVIPHVAVSQILIARAMPRLNRLSLEATGRNTGDLTAFIACADAALLYDAQGYLMERFEQSSKALLKANMRIHARNALGAAIMPLFGLGGHLVLLAVGSSWIGAGALTFGDLTAAFQYRGGILAGAIALISCMISIQSSMAGIRRLNDTMDEGENIPTPETTEGANG